MNDVSDVDLVSFVLPLKIFHTFFQCYYCCFEQLNICWKECYRRNNLPKYTQLTIFFVFMENLQFGINSCFCIRFDFCFRMKNFNGILYWIYFRRGYFFKGYFDLPPLSYDQKFCKIQRFSTTVDYDIMQYLF